MYRESFLGHSATMKGLLAGGRHSSSSEIPRAGDDQVLFLTNSGLSTGLTMLCSLSFERLSAKGYH
jgi:hypothetical protein